MNRISADAFFPAPVLRKTRLFFLLLIISLFLSRTPAAGDNTQLAMLLTRELGFVITAKGASPTATADLEILADGKVLKSYHALPLGVQNKLEGDLFPRSAPLEVRVAIRYQDKGGAEHLYMDREPLILPANPPARATTYGIDYDLTAQ